MVQSEQQKAILELGKLLVKELDLVKSVDTLSRWMAHYLAEKIHAAASLPEGAKKNKAEKECVSLILDLWKHRWHYKREAQPMRKFNRLYEILKSLDPDKEDPFFIRYMHEEQNAEEEIFYDLTDLKNLSPLALKVDKVARIWINFLLHEAAEMDGNEDIKKIINYAVRLPASIDAKIIQIILEETFEDDTKGDELTDEKLPGKNEIEKKNKIISLNDRIKELKNFRELNEYLINQFEDELHDLENKGS